jgi:hypothetical protein
VSRVRAIAVYAGVASFIAISLVLGLPIALMSEGEWQLLLLRYHAKETKDHRVVEHADALVRLGSKGAVVLVEELRHGRWLLYRGPSAFTLLRQIGPRAKPVLTAELDAITRANEPEWRELDRLAVLTALVCSLDEVHRLPEWIEADRICPYDRNVGDLERRMVDYLETNQQEAPPSWLRDVGHSDKLNPAFVTWAQAKAHARSSR